MLPFPSGIRYSFILKQKFEQIVNKPVSSVAHVTIEGDPQLIILIFLFDIGVYMLIKSLSVHRKIKDNIEGYPFFLQIRIKAVEP